METLTRHVERRDQAVQGTSVANSRRAQANAGVSAGASASASAYRPDIDGLRAIAVLSVIGYHAFPRSVPGGFTGVDVFFVISGYLISSMIFADLQRARFRFTSFYARRFRRIFPALAVVLGVCLVYGWVALAPDEFRELGKQTAASAGFGANVLFWRESGYFDVSSTLKPLLHLWSLGIEEQFYLIWPAIIVLAWGRSTRLWVIAAAIVAGSFAANLALAHTAPVAAFFLPVSRFWELLLGALLAYLQYRLSVTRDDGTATGGGAGAWLRSSVIRRPIPAHAVAAIGLLFIAATLLVVNSSKPFPGWWALVPATGTALLIATPSSWLNRRLLASRLMVGIGLISYPLYLWHWVMLTFGRIARDGDDLPRTWRLALIGGSFVLAWLTFRLVERPIRFSPRRHTMPVTLIASVLLCGIAGLLAYGSNGAAFRYPPQIRPFAAARYDSARNFYEDDAYRGGTCFLDAEDVDFSSLAKRCADATGGTSPLLAVWGDSHAASLYPGLRAMLPKDRYRIAQFTASACPPLLGTNQPQRPNCRAFNDAVIRQLTALHPAIVILEAHWALYMEGPISRFDPNALRNTIQALADSGVPRIVVMGSLPSWKIFQPRAAFLVWRRTHALVARSNLYLDDAAFAADHRVHEAVAGTPAIFVSPVSLLCNPRGCLLSADPQHHSPVAWDNDHLSLAGSSLLIRLAMGDIVGKYHPESGG
jgi:peptidoglycan/LPS O-acetylase OafA/YrhL